MVKHLPLELLQLRNIQPHHAKNRPSKFIRILKYQPLASRSRIRLMLVHILKGQTEFVADGALTQLSYILRPNNFACVFL